ncbi:MAG: O-methyltransferase [Chloroflexi bacterium]|nr:O-methyltransferase [Chloroflexota bacterium]
MDDLLGRIDAYIEDLFAPEDEALRAARAATAAAGLPAINVSPVQGKTLYLLARLVSARRILEIGTLGGYSAIWLARALPPGGTLLSLEIDERHASVARGNLARAGVGDRVEVRVGPAQPALAALAEAGTEPYDLVFVDADKPSYPAYLAGALLLSRPGTVIVADNVVQRGRVIDAPAGGNDDIIQRFNRLLADDPRLEAIILPVLRGNIDGLAVARVRATA